jgi:hypothetical protein
MKRSYKILIGTIYLIGLFLCIHHSVAASQQYEILSPGIPHLDPTGSVTVQGAFYYYDRHNELQGAGFSKVSLYDYDSVGGDDSLFATYTIDGGSFDFPSLTNDDNDDPFDPDRHLDLYVIWETYSLDLGSTYHRVTYLGGQTYKWQSSTRTNVQDGIVDFTGIIPTNSASHPAMWIFQDLRNAWNSIYTNTAPHVNPGSVTLKWEQNQDCYVIGQTRCTSFFYGTDIGGPFIFLSDANRDSSDIVTHETGHNYMYNTSGWWGGIPHVGTMKCFPKLMLIALGRKGGQIFCR